MAGGRRVNYLQRILIIVFGMLFAAAFYFKFAMGNSQAVSHYGFGLAAIIGFLSVPATLIAANMGKRNVWTAIGGVLIAAAMFSWLFIVSFGAGLPGNEWIGAEMVNAVLFLPFVTAVVLLIRLPKALRTLGISLLICFLLFAIGVQMFMRQTLETQIVLTLQQGGCVLSGREIKKIVQSAKLVSFGWFISPRSDQVYFVEGNKYFKWSYANFGVESRRGEPESFPLTSDLNCKT
jgi:hypothetical protein